jgi:hypothetical protein
MIVHGFNFSNSWLVRYSDDFGSTFSALTPAVWGLTSCLSETGDIVLMGGGVPNNTGNFPIGSGRMILSEAFPETVVNTGKTFTYDGLSYIGNFSKSGSAMSADGKKIIVQNVKTGQSPLVYRSLV